MSRKILGPFNRVEGDLEVVLDVDGGRVASAHVNATMYRGFEQIMIGRSGRPLRPISFQGRNSAETSRLFTAWRLWSMAIIDQYPSL